MAWKKIAVATVIAASLLANAMLLVVLFWRDSPYWIADHLVDSRDIIGMSVDKVADKLGDEASAGPISEWNDEWDYAIYIGPERGFLPFDSEYIYVKVDACGYIIDAMVTTR